MVALLLVLVLVLVFGFMSTIGGNICVIPWVRKANTKTPYKPTHKATKLFIVKYMKVILYYF